MQGKAVNLSRTPRQEATAPFCGDFTPPEKFGGKVPAEAFDRRRNGTAGLAAIRPAPPVPPLADEALLEGLRRGMPDAIEVLFNRYRAKVYNLAMSIVRNESDAEEVTQDVLLTVIRKVDTFKGNSAFYSWIYRICVNASLIRVRERRRPDTVSIEEFMPVFTEDGMHAHPVDDWSKEIERKALDKELGRMIRKFTSHLSEKYRVVFILSEVEGLSNEETAQVLNLTLPAVKSRLHRARLYLRGRLSVYLRDGLSE